MSDERDRKGQHDLDRRLRSALGPERVSGARRQHLRYRLFEHEEREMRRLKRYSWLELGAVAAALLIVVVSLWSLDLFGGDDTPAESPLGAQPVATLTAEPSPEPTSLTSVDSQCDVTPPSDAPPPSLIGDPMFTDWYGGDDIMVGTAPGDGTSGSVPITSADEFWLSPLSILGVNPSLPTSPYRWFTGGIPALVNWPDMHQESLSLTARQIDGPTATIALTEQKGVEWRGVAGGYINQFLLTFPEPGCWEVAARSSDWEATFVVEVGPLEERPDMVQARELHALLPYEPPATCAVTLWRGPVDEDGRFLPYYWLDGDGVASRSHTGIVWALEPAPLEWFLDEWGPIEITGASVVNGIPLQLESDPIQRAGIDGQRWFSTLYFSEPGCWEIEATAGEQTLQAVIWVYPPECKRESGEDIPTLCELPD